MHERTRDRDALTLATRELVGELVELVDEPEVSEQLDPAVVVGVRAPERELETDVLGRGQERQQVVRLEHEPEVVATQARPLTLG